MKFPIFILICLGCTAHATLVTSLSQAPGLGSDIDLTSGSIITWGYSTGALNDGVSNFKSLTSAATQSHSGSDSTRDYGYTFTFNDGNSPGSGSTVASSGGVAGLLASTTTSFSLANIVSPQLRTLTLYVGGYEGGNDSFDATFDATLTGGSLDETGIARVFSVDQNSSSAAGGAGGGYATAIYTVSFSSLTETDLVIDLSYSNLSGTRNLGISGYTVTTAIPEPSSLALLGLAGLVWGVFGTRSKAS